MNKSNLITENIMKCTTHQLSPRYEGQLMSDGGAYSTFRSILLVLTHDFIIICVYGPTGSDGHDGWYQRGRWLRTIFGRLRRKECCMLGAPFSQPTAPLHELPPARLVIHRQTSAMNEVSGRVVFNRGRAY